MGAISIPIWPNTPLPVGQPNHLMRYLPYLGGVDNFHLFA
jgi:hypothetical protein